MFQLNDRVRFFRGSLPEYQVSLDDIEGLVCSTRPDAPPGWITIWIDWDSSPYDARTRELPTWINVPPTEVKPLESKPASKMQLVGEALPEARHDAEKTRDDAETTRDADDAPESPAKPTLRLL